MEGYNAAVAEPGHGRQLGQELQVEEDSMYRLLLIPLDGSAFGEQALPIVCAIARRAGAILHMVHVGVASPNRTAASDDQTASTLDQSRAYLDRLREAYARTCGIEIHSVLLDAPDDRAETIANVLVAQLNALHADQVVMSTHGRSGIARLWLGSVAEALIRHAPVPVLAMRPRTVLPESDVAPMVRRILIPLDGSAEAETILIQVRRLGMLMGSEYILCHVVSPFILVPPPPAVSGGVEGPDFVEQRYAAAEDYLLRIAGKMQEDALSVQVCVLGDPNPATAILAEACRQQVDLVAMMTHGRCGVDRVLRGSVAGNLVHDTTIPVFLYRPQSFDQSVG